MNEDEFQLEPVEIHPEQYATNLFGEETATGKPFEKSSDIPSGHGQTVSHGLPSAFNIFSFTDAIGARNKREAWMLYQKALASGMVAEELFYKFVWQVKIMLLASRTNSALEADMKDYPYRKAKGFLKNFKSMELERLSEKLVLGYHSVRRGEGEIETFVEKTILSL